MILDKKEIIELNRQMVDGGAPIEVDNTGYNQCHYWRMVSLSHIPEITDLQAYAILDTLKYYWNTQLAGYKDDIKESIEHYSNLLGKKETDKYDMNKSMFKHAEAEYNKTQKDLDKTRSVKPINIVSFNSVEITVNYNGFVDGIKDFVAKNKGEARWNKTPDGKWNLVLNWNIVPNFIKLIGEYQYASESLNDMSKYIDVFREEWLAEEREKGYWNVEIIPTKNHERYDLVLKTKNPNMIKTILFSKKNLCSKINAVDEEVSCSVYHRDLEDFKKLLTEKASQFIIDWTDFDKLIEEDKAFLTPEYNLLNPATLDLPFTPYDYQVEDAKKIISKTRTLISHEMGCGKTLISIMVGESIPKKKLVIVPESLRLNWVREIKMANKDAEVEILYSKDAFHTGNEWTVTGYKTAEKFKNQLLAENFEVLFIDEAHYCKSVNNYGNPTSKRGEAVMELAEKAKYCYPITGTPIPTRNKDAYNLLKMLDVPDIAKYSFYDYGMQYCDGQSNGYGMDFSGNSNPKKLHDILQSCMVRRMTKEALPNLKSQRIPVPINGNSKIIKENEKLLDLMLAGNDSVTMGYAMTYRKNTSEVKVLSAIDLADTILAEEKPVVIACLFKDTVDKIKEYYGDDCCCIVGGMSDVEKQQAIDDFQGGKKKVCAMNMIAGGVGITLTKSSHMIMCDMDWTPSNMLQVEARINRSGQKDLCHFFYIYIEDDPIDKYFIDMISTKNENTDKVVDDIENRMDLNTDLSTTPASDKKFRNLADELRHVITESREGKNIERIKAIKNRNDNIDVEDDINLSTDSLLDAEKEVGEFLAGNNTQTNEIIK